MNTPIELDYRFAREGIFEVLGSKLRGKRVLIPAFTCADFVGLFRSLNCKINFISVDCNLRLVGSYTEWPEADFFVFTHYLGAKNDKTEVQKYQKLHSCIVIEDNAHAVCDLQDCRHVNSHDFDVEIISYRKANQLDFGAKILINNDNIIRDVYYRNEGLRSLEPGNTSIRSWLRVNVNLNYLRALKFYMTGFYDNFSRIKMVDQINCLSGLIKPHCVASSKNRIRKNKIRKNMLIVNEIVESNKLVKLGVSTGSNEDLTFGTLVTTENRKLLRFLMLRHGLNIFPWPEIDRDAATHLSNKLLNTWIICHL